MAETMGALQDQEQREEVFTIIVFDEYDSKRNQVVPQSKMRGTMKEFSDQLLKGEIRSLYVRRE